MNIVVVVDDVSVEVFKNWSQVKKHTSFTKEDFAPVGNDWMLKCDSTAFEISKDIKLLEHVAAKKMFTKNKFDMSDLLSVITLLLVFIGLVN